MGSRGLSAHPSTEIDHQRSGKPADRLGQTGGYHVAPPEPAGGPQRAPQLRTAARVAEARKTQPRPPNHLEVGELLRQARAVLAYSPELAIEVRDGSRAFVLHVLQQWISAINGQDRRLRPLRPRHFRPPGLRKKISGYARKIGGCALRPLPKIWRPRLSSSNLRRMRDAPRSSGPRKGRGA